MVESLPDGAYGWRVRVDLVDPNPRQPRSVFDEVELEELTRSVAAVGVLQPICVRPGPGERWTLVAGERRLRAAQRAELATIPAVVRDVPDDDLLLDAIVENVHRANLNPVELAHAYQQLLDDVDLTQAQVAEALGVDRSKVNRTLALLNLPESVQRRVAAGVLSASHADALGALKDPSVQELLALRIVREGLSVAAVRELIAVGGLPGAESVDGRAQARKQRRPVAVELAQLATDLGDELDTRVRVLAGKSRGRIVVDFSDRDDLARIVAKLRCSSGR